MNRLARLTEQTLKVKNILESVGSHWARRVARFPTGATAHVASTPRSPRTRSPSSSRTPRLRPSKS
jgi:hypothetical protein